MTVWRLTQSFSVAIELCTNFHLIFKSEFGLRELWDVHRHWILNSKVSLTFILSTSTTPLLCLSISYANFSRFGSFVKASKFDLDSSRDLKYHAGATWFVIQAPTSTPTDRCATNATVKFLQTSLKRPQHHDHASSNSIPMKTYVYLVHDFARLSHYSWRLAGSSWSTIRVDVHCI